MRFTETRIPGAFVIDPEPRVDERGFFARVFCAREFAEHGLSESFVQMNISASTAKGTLRGLHYQREPASETKVVRCTRGAIYDVIVDLRPASATYLQHVGVTLTSGNHLALYIPKMFAHAYQALCDDVEVVYQVDSFYSPGHERGLRYDDPVLGIRWPETVTVVSEKDRTWPLIAAAGSPAAG
ncbi:MAG TPA: dTDP-4-dehydrorhamnose 3,5-epimerase [Thermoanaerobaculia bacterium]|nr:dTDP-4-dehydrorhamnose 3,5-epimerase [Thermoanaerobaculia bacterium]